MEKADAADTRIHTNFHETEGTILHSIWKRHEDE